MPFPPKPDEPADTPPPSFGKKKSGKKRGGKPFGKKGKAAPIQKSMMQSGRSFGRR